MEPGPALSLGGMFRRRGVGTALAWLFLSDGIQSCKFQAACASLLPTDTVEDEFPSLMWNKGHPSIHLASLAGMSDGEQQRFVLTWPSTKLYIIHFSMLLQMADIGIFKGMLYHRG